MRHIGWLTVLLCVLPLPGQETAEGPTDAKAQKTFNEALEYVHRRMPDAALGSFKKADKQDGGHCTACKKKILKYAVELRDWKTAETAATELVGEAKDAKQIAITHYQVGLVLMQEGLDRRKEECFSRAHEEFGKALAAYASFPDAIFADGQALAHMNQDDAAKAQFERFVKMKPAQNVDRQRAMRYIDQPELARARMAPAFEVTTMDGQHLSLDDLKGKVVLIDFWATWCSPCREAVPHLKKIANNFHDQPLVVLSVSLDTDEQKWKDFVANNEMTWPQTRCDGFPSPIPRMFSVNAIPHTFTIDADGVLQDEHIGDASVEGKLKKLLARAREMPVVEKPAQ